MSSVNSFFDKVVLLNLKRRPDRLFHSDLALKTHGIAYERFEAVDGESLKDEAMLVGMVPGALACAQSHLAILKMCRDKGYASVLICEDDCEFRPNFTENWENWSKQVNEDWALLYLSGNHGIARKDGKHPYLVRPHVQRIFNTLTTAAWACHNLAYDLVIDRISKMDQPVDVMLCEVQSATKAFAFYPSLIVQRAGYSDVEGCFTSYSGVIT